MPKSFPKRPTAISLAYWFCSSAHLLENNRQWCIRHIYSLLGISLEIMCIAAQLRTQYSPEHNILQFLFLSFSGNHHQKIVSSRSLCFEAMTACCLTLLLKLNTTALNIQSTIFIYLSFFTFHECTFSIIKINNLSVQLYVIFCIIIIVLTCSSVIVFE